MTDIFKEVYEKLDADTYRKIQKIGKFSTYGLVGTNIFLASQNVQPNTLSLTATFLLSASCFGVNYLYDRGRTESIREPYQEFIKNYNEDINKTFHLSNPLEVYYVFNILLSNGYLSKNKEFHYYDNPIFADVENLLGTEIFSGISVCRHSSAMLSDILNEFGTPACQLGVNVVNDDISTRRRLNPFVYANHAIVFATQDEKSYFLDPTINTAYRRDQENPNILYYDDNEKIRILINKNTSTIINITNKNYKLIRQNLLKQYPSVSLEEEHEKFKQLYAFCQLSAPYLEKFFAHNQEIYRDIDDKLEKIKIKKRK